MPICKNVYCTQNSISIWRWWTDRRNLLVVTSISNRLCALIFPRWGQHIANSNSPAWQNVRLKLHFSIRLLLHLWKAWTLSPLNKAKCLKPKCPLMVQYNDHPERKMFYMIVPNNNIKLHFLRSLHILLIKAYVFCNSNEALLCN